MEEKTQKQKDREKIIESFEKGAGRVAMKCRAMKDEDIKSLSFFIEHTYTHKEGGKYTKFYGINALWRGLPLRSHTDVVHIAKIVSFFLPYRIVGSSLTLKAYFGGLFFFWQSQFWHLVAYTMRITQKRTVNTVLMGKEEYNQVEREVERAVNEAIKREIGEADFQKLRKNPNRKDKLDRYRFIKDWTDFFCLVLYLDNAYRYRFQDLAGVVLKGGKIERVLPVILDIAASRERQGKTMFKKAKWAKRVLSVALLRDRKLKRVLQRAYEEIEFERCVMDDHDKYFAFLTGFYHYYGLTSEQMKSEWERLDKLFKNTYIDIIREDMAKYEAVKNKIQEVCSIEEEPRLANVLNAWKIINRSSEGKKMHYNYSERITDIVDMFNLVDDRLSEQPEELIDFLDEILRTYTTP